MSQSTAGSPAPASPPRTQGSAPQRDPDPEDLEPVPFLIAAMLVVAAVLGLLWLLGVLT